MHCLNMTHPLRSRVFWHVDVDDHKIRRTIKGGVVRPAGADTISFLAQPLLQQSARERVFFVYHDVQTVLILHLPGWRIARRACVFIVSRADLCLRSDASNAILEPASRAVMSAGYGFITVETSQMRQQESRSLTVGKLTSRCTSNVT